eukprot:1274871-Pleurochrysis_carterae.AAC.1
MKRLLSPELPLGGFQLRGLEFAEAEVSVREAALHHIWERNYGDVYIDILNSNPRLVQLLCGRTANTYTGRLEGSEEIESRRLKRLNFLGGLLARSRNQHFMPKHQLLLAMQARHKQLNQSSWAQLCHMRILPSFTWTGNLIAAALVLESDCVPKYDVVDWLSAA